MIAWQKAHLVAVEIYKITQSFPKEELFALTSQIRRAAVSASSNIAEGFGRRTKNDRLHFYDMSRASLAELQSQLLIARDIGYLEGKVFDKTAHNTVECHKVITGLINATKGLDS